MSGFKIYNYDSNNHIATEVISSEYTQKILDNIILNENIVESINDEIQDVIDKYISPNIQFEILNELNKIESRNNIQLKLSIILNKKEYDIR